MRIFTASRILSLAAIALFMAGLAYLRFAPGGDSISVPTGARSGDLVMKSCKYETEKGSYAADCGTLVVPENRAAPGSRLIALPVTRIRARSARPAEPIFILQGGPGITNMEFAKASRYAADHDVILVGYRGVDGSVRLDCPEVESALKHSRDLLGEESLRAYGNALRACANRLTNEGVDLAGYGIPQQVDDLEAARGALHYGRIDLLSESAGTRKALVYSWRYPESIHRSVMIGVNPPGHFLWNPKTTDEQMARYADLCANDESCSKRTGDLTATIRRTAADIPGRWWFLPIKDGHVRVLSFFGLMESTANGAPVSGPMILDSWISAAKGDASGFWFASLMADIIVPKSFVWGEYAAVGRADAQAARDYFSSRTQEDHLNLGDSATTFVWGGGLLADAWPASPGEGEYNRVRTSEVETLLIGGAVDFSTPPQIATKELLPYLPNGHEVILPGLGHTGSFFAAQPDAGNRLINTFFGNGQVDDSLYRPISVDFTPRLTLTLAAKLILSVMIGLALVPVLSLLWMARHVYRRDRLGRKASTGLRSVYPVLLGLGGWSFGVLVLLTMLPGVPLDNEVVAIPAVGVPVGLCVYSGWLQSDMARKAKTVGLVAALVGAVVGVWLGYEATAGVFAIITTIVGAIAVANLTLITLDVTNALLNRQRDVAGETPPQLQPWLPGPPG